MIIKPNLLRDYLQEKQLSAEFFADELDIAMFEVEKLLNGEVVGIKTANLFIHHFGADKAQHFIDWETLGKKNPLANELPAEVE